MNMEVTKDYETSRLFFREIQESDACEIVRWRSDPEAFVFFKNPHKITESEHLNWYNNIYSKQEARIDFIGFEQKSGKKIGVFGVCQEDKEVEVNYLVDRNFRNNGYASEAVRWLIEFSYNRWNPDRIVAEIHKKNVSSIRMIQKLGFSLYREKSDFVIYSL